jgi:methyl-accepting chemotaxis protein
MAFCKGVFAMFRRLSIMGKMIVAVCITGIVLVVIGFVGVSYVNKIGGMLKQSNGSELVAIQTLSNAKSSIAQYRAAAAQAILAEDGATSQSYIKETSTMEQDLVANLNEFKRIELNSGRQQAATKVQTDWQEYSTTVKASMDLAQQGRPAEARASLTNASSKLKIVMTGIDQLLQDNAKQLKDLSEQSDKVVAQTQQGFLLFVLLGGIVSLGLGVFVAKSISSPLTQMAATSEMISRGKLSTGVQVVNTQDEVGSLSQSFNLMVDNLSQVLREIANSSKQITGSTRQLNLGMSQITKSAEQIAETAQNVAIGSEGQVRSVEQVTAAISQMSFGVKQIAENAQSVSTSSNNAYKHAEFGRETIDKAIRQMESIRQTVDKSAGVIKELGDKSKTIGNIIDLIRNIADQTNLLALNAAIEAARAGEQGRGFAVVAEEVRKLAEQSASATKEIAILITSVKDETERAVKAMDLGTKEAAQGTIVVSDAGNAFTDILSAVDGVSQQIHQVSMAAQELASGSGQVVNAVETIAYIAQETSGQTQNVAAAAQEQTASMEEIKFSVNSLFKMSGELDDIVKRFQLQN